ncbi:hypothetical protein JCM15764A_32120 [Geotalea toluenoxydans]
MAAAIILAAENGFYEGKGGCLFSASFHTFEKISMGKPASCQGTLENTDRGVLTQDIGKRHLLVPV